tara:strand:+ start:136 stop:420 length:285 start_codon:yes stop_codon:yes gene_type:complete
MKRPNRKDYIDKSTKIQLIADQEQYIDFIEKQLEAINYTRCCTELKVDKKAEINKLNDLLKDTEEDEGLKLNNPIEWGRRVGCLEGKINYLCNL